MSHRQTFFQNNYTTLRADRLINADTVIPTVVDGEFVTHDNNFNINDNITIRASNYTDNDLIVPVMTRSVIISQPRSVITSQRGETLTFDDTTSSSTDRYLVGRNYINMQDNDIDTNERHHQYSRNRNIGVIGTTLIARDNIIRVNSSNNNIYQTTQASMWPNYDSAQYGQDVPRSDDRHPPTPGINCEKLDELISKKFISENDILEPMLCMLGKYVMTDPVHFTNLPQYIYDRPVIEHWLASTRMPSG